MLKLVATDLDGTLLLGDASLPTETFSVIRALKQKDVLFCVASGRQLASLTELFAPVADQILFIAENGALVYDRGEILYQKSIPFAALPDILSAIRTQPEARTLLCCRDCAYAWENDPVFLAECRKYYPRFQLLSSSDEVPMSDPICKIAVFDGRGSAQFSGKTLPALLPAYRTVTSGKVWCDVSLPDTNKGNALCAARDKLGISADECMAFGDYMNDYELLLACEHAFVPENGYPPLIAKIGRTVPPNTQNGVLQKIKEEFNV